jgi:acyl-CoA synthetase (AMP-forming)/AMP-acid ligase II
MTDAEPDLLALVRRGAARCGEREFLRVGARALTGSSFADAVHAAAGGLLELGLQRGDRVAALLPRSVDEAVWLLAIAAAGGVAVPIHGRLKDQQVAHILADCEPFAVVASSVRLLALSDPGATLAGRRCLRVDAAELPTPSQPAPSSRRELAPPAPDDACFLLYTSGSTGLAKGIVQTHRNLALGAALVADYLGLRATDRILALLPFSFDYGLNQLLGALHVGAAVVAADHLGVGELATLLRAHRPTGLAGVPSLWHEVAAGIASGALTAADGASLRYMTNSGGALRQADGATVRRAWPHVLVFAMYGLTEAFRSAYLPPGEYDQHPDSFGRALPGVELLLVDPETGVVLDGPGVGELVHAGALVAKGYWRRPEADRERFRPDPRGVRGSCVYSGDLVRRDDAGRHYFLARRDRMLKVAGHRISPDEVAAAVAGMDGVGEVAVFGEDGGVDGHRIVLCCAGDVADAELPERIRRRCRARLPSYMQPAVLRVLPALPHNRNGKVDEGALRAMLTP